jgi:thioesterase domain-containing protein
LATRPDGNCALLGYCMGGIIALEMARQLRQQGHRVGPVVLIETPLLCKRSTWHSRCAERWRNAGVSMRWLAQRMLLQCQTHRRREQRLYGHAHRVLIRKRHRGLLLRYPFPTDAQDVVCLLAEQTRRRLGMAECEQLVHTLQPTPQRITVPGDHRSCVRNTHLPHLAKILHRILEKHP